MSAFIGPYELRGELGRGAMSIVWRAWDPNLEREVAIKEPVIPHGTSPEVASELAARFVREGKAVAKLNHPGIVTVFDSGIYDGRPGMVMELIEGTTLSDLLYSEKRLDSPTALSVAIQLLDALSFAHERGIVHRDVKPDNVFVTADGRIKLADFGIARLADQTRYTQEGTVMGTPGYMAPEQVRGLPADARADVFSAGAILYEMLTGANPFGASEGIDSTSVMYRIVHEDPPRADAVVPQLPGWLGQVTAVALAKDPANRYQTAGAMREDLRAQSASVKVKAKAVRGGVQKSAVVLGVVAVAGIAIIALAMSAASGGSSVSPATSSSPGQAATTPSSGSSQAASPEHDAPSNAAAQFSSSITVWRPTVTNSSEEPKFVYGVAAGGPHYSYTWDSIGESLEGTVKNGGWGTSDILAEQIQTSINDEGFDLIPVKMGRFWVYPVYGSGVSQFLFLDPKNVDSSGIPLGGMPYYIYETSSPDDATKFIAGLEPIK